MTEKIKIPKDVVNKQAYIKYIAYSKHPILRNTILTASDGTEVNLGMLPHMLRKRVEHLPPKEQEYFIDLKQKFMVLLQKKNVAKGQAYGNMGRPGKGGKKTQEDYAKKAEVALEQDIITLLGRMFSIAEVVRILVEDNGIAVSANKVKEIMAKNLTTIERLREEFRNKVTDVRLYNKRPRLEELAWMYSKMKMRYIAMNSTEAYNAMLRTLEQLRKEAEGDILNINGNVDVNLNIELQAHIQKEIIKTINLKEIILGRIAARMNYDTKKLVAGLHNSYYNQFVQISGDYNPEAEMQYPSLINYDFADIERKNAERDDVVDIQAEEVTEEEHEKASTIKDLFLAKIRKQKEQYEARTSTAVTEETEFHAQEDYEELNRSSKRMRYDASTKKEKRKEYQFTPESKQRQIDAICRGNDKRWDKNTDD